MSRSRVLYVLGSLAANDMGDEIVTMLGHLPRDRFEPQVVALGGREELKSRFEEMQVTTRSLGLVGPLGAYRAVSRVRALIGETGARLVHGYGSWGGSVAQLAAPRDVSVVRTVTRAPTHERDLRGRVLRWMEKRARTRVAIGTRFVVPNEGSVGLAVRAYNAADGHVSVLPTSVDVAEVRDHVHRRTREGARTLMGIAPDHFAVALMTDFGSGAWMDQLLSGVALVLREREDLRVFVVGSGRYEGSTRWKAEELQLGDSIVFLGRGSAAGPIWAAADLAVDATAQSSWSRSGLLSIGAQIPTVKLQEGVGGWSEDLDEHLPMLSGHPERFATDLVRLAADPDARAEIGRAGAKIAEEVDVKNVVERLSDIYGSLLEREQ